MIAKKCFQFVYESYDIFYLYRGKGDYHRLGHGTDDHIRCPRRVGGLQNKKVISIATGSLHCVCCTDQGSPSTTIATNVVFFFGVRGQY